MAIALTIPRVSGLGFRIRPCEFRVQGYRYREIHPRTERHMEQSMKKDMEPGVAPKFGAGWQGGGGMRGGGIDRQTDRWIDRYIHTDAWHTKSHSLDPTLGRGKDG